MAAAGVKSGQTTRSEIEKKFREEFGRDLTPEEKRLLGWAEMAIADSPNNPKPPEGQKRNAS